MFESGVLDSASTGALLKLARNEGLLHEDRWATDAFVDTYAPNSVPEWLQAQIVEQIILTPNLATFQRLPERGLNGELFDDGVLTFAENVEPDLTPLRIPAEMIIGALHARGHEWSWSDVQARFERGWLAEVEAEKFKQRHGHALPTDWMWVMARMHAFMAGKGNDNDEPPEGYTRDDVDIAMRHQADRRDAQPILNVVDELLQLFAYAQRHGRLFRPAVIPTHGMTLRVGKAYKDTLRAGALFRIVVRRLEVPTHGLTLRKALEVARDPAAASLRQHLPLWLNELAAGNVKPAVLIEREIRRASESLVRSGKQARAGRLIGYFTVPMAVAEFFLNLPPLAGLSIQLISEVTGRKAIELSRNAEWVHLGSRRSSSGV